MRVAKPDGLSCPKCGCTHIQSHGSRWQCQNISCLFKWMKYYRSRSGQCKESEQLIPSTEVIDLTSSAKEKTGKDARPKTEAQCDKIIAFVRNVKAFPEE